MERRTQAERTETSKRELVEAATVLFGQHGYAGTTLREVGERAGVSSGLATYHFGSKETLFRAALESIRRTATDFAKPTVAGLRGMARLEAVVDAYLRSYAENTSPTNPNLGRDLGRTVLVATAEAISATPELRDLVAENDGVVRQMVIDSLTEAIEDGELSPEADTGLMAVAVVGLMRGIALQWLVSPDVVSIEAVLPTVREMIRTLQPDP